MPGKWHNMMENKFPKQMREVKFYCSSIDSNTCRRADICLNDIRTCEIQHSYISENEIIKRCKDWKKFGKQIIWLIDGNEGVELDKLSTGTYIIIFKTIWKYKSFIETYDFILLEKDELVFKIELNKIKSGMIELKEAKTLEETINYLKTKPENIWDFWSDENVVKSVLGVYQQGAGNGKTYGIWKSIIENVNRKTYIIVTKQHSAKTVIYQELIDQKTRFINGGECFHIKKMEHNSECNTEKHYVIKYTNKQSKRECIVIIGTIDSFCYNLSHSNAKGANFFKGIIDNMIDKGATKINNGNMKFGGQSIQLSKECEIWIDEVQDLPENYFYAMIKLMYETSCYINIVGDKLQSLEFSNNFLTKIVIKGLPNIKLDIKQPINKNRCIKVTNMEREINKLIRFDKFELPIIECDIEIVKENNTEPIKIIDSPVIYANDTGKGKIESVCNTIMDMYIYEIETNDYSPNDFLIIFPIMKNNVMAPELQSKIQEYWINKRGGKYTQYVYLHKHTNGTVINTNDSINATRIMSVRSSKGDGRKVVFILNVTERSLKIVSNKENGLVYESYLHVALTRAKNQIYFGLTKNNDEIHKRFRNIGYVECLPEIDKKIGLEKINELINKDKLIDLLIRNGVRFNNIIETEVKITHGETVDWGYHCIKYHTFYYNVILNIVNNKKQNFSQKNSELFVKLRIISNLTINTYNVKEFYEFLNTYQYKDIPHFPLCKFSDKPEYNKYYKKIKYTLQIVQKNIQTETLDKLNVYESIILTYMIQIQSSQKYSEMSPVDLYNITYFFENNTNKEKELLNNIGNIKNIIDKSGIKNYKNINWNIFKQIEINSKIDNFKINKFQFPIIGKNETEIIHIVLKTTINKLNFWDIIIEILLERFLIYNPKSEKDNQRFKDKKIYTYIFLLDTNSFIKIDWNWDKLLKTDIKKELYKIMKSHYKHTHADIYKHFIHKKNNSVLWKKDPSEIIKCIINEYIDIKRCPNYIIQFFQSIKGKMEDGEDYEYIYNKSTFKKKLKTKLKDYIKKYLDL